MKGKALAASLLLLLSTHAEAQGNDPDFDPAVSCPAYGPGVGPRLLLDEAHRNLHTASGRYASFAAVAARDGFRVESSTATFAQASPPEGAILFGMNHPGTDDRQLLLDVLHWLSRLL